MYKYLLSILTLANTTLFALNSSYLNVSKLRIQQTFLQRGILKNKTFRGLACLTGALVCFYLASKKPSFSHQDLTKLKDLRTEIDRTGDLDSIAKKDLMENLLKKASEFAKANPKAYRLIEKQVANAQESFNSLN